MSTFLMKEKVKTLNFIKYLNLQKINNKNIFGILQF